MAVRPVVRYPARILKTPAEPVGDVGTPEKELATDLVDTMHAAPACVGVAAPQISVSRRAFAVDVSLMRRPRPNHGLIVLFDPQVLHGEGSEVAREGCLSVPDWTCDVRRATHLVMRGTTPDARLRVVEAEGFEARALQHELDHLDGMLILDRVTSARTGVFRRKRYADPGRHLR